eukprot:PRCOL_00001966-RA
MSPAGRCRVYSLGFVPYARGLALQRALWLAARRGRAAPALLALQHAPAVLTLGRRADAAHVLASDGELKAAGIDVHRVPRGGEATYHAPGQAVLYPIVTLAPARRARATAGLTSSGAVAIGVRKYVEHLEDVMIGAAARRGIAARGRVPGHTGVWAGDGDPNERVQADAGTGTDAFDGPRKLGAVGVQVRERVTTHGLALNVDLDVDMYTRLIVPCGMPGASATSLALEMARAGRPTAADELCVRRVLQEMSSDLCERLGFEPEERPTEELDVLLAEFAGDLEDNARV